MVSESKDPTTQETSPIEDLDDTCTSEWTRHFDHCNESRKVEFRFLQETMGLTAVTSQHIRVLEKLVLSTSEGDEGRRLELGLHHKGWQGCSSPGDRGPEGVSQSRRSSRVFDIAHISW